MKTKAKSYCRDSWEWGSIDAWWPSLSTLEAEAQCWRMVIVTHSRQCRLAFSLSVGVVTFEKKIHTRVRTIVCGGRIRSAIVLRCMICPSPQHTCGVNYFVKHISIRSLPSLPPSLTVEPIVLCPSSDTTHPHKDNRTDIHLIHVTYIPSSLVWAWNNLLYSPLFCATTPRAMMTIVAKTTAPTTIPAMAPLARLSLHLLCTETSKESVCSFLSALALTSSHATREQRVRHIEECSTYRCLCNVATSQWSYFPRRR